MAEVEHLYLCMLRKMTEVENLPDKIRCSVVFCMPTLLAKVEIGRVASCKIDVWLEAATQQV
jgi:hypothetical protein